MIRAKFSQAYLRLVSFGIGVGFFIFISTSIFAASLTKINFTQDASKIDLILSLDAAVNYRVFGLINPTRLVIDLNNTNFATTVNRSYGANTPIKNIRIGKHENHRLRIVLDLHNPVTFRHFLTAGNLIIEIFPNDKKSKSAQPTAVIATPLLKKNKVAVINRVVKPPVNATQLSKVKVVTTPIKTVINWYGLHASAIASEMLKIKIPENMGMPIIPVSLNAKSAVVPVVVKTKITPSFFHQLWLFAVKLFSIPDQPKFVRDVIIVVDPGHGGKDPGVVGVEQTKEKDVVLAIAKKLQLSLNRERNFKILLTRDGDDFLALRERLQFARANKADLFISIHADTYEGSDYAGGVTIFALSQHGATSAAARWLATRENASELANHAAQESFNLRSLLIKLAQNESIATSLRVGDTILQRLANVTHLHKHQIEQASFVVLKSPDIPSLLIESGFISDPHEEKQLKDPQYQAKLADAIALGIKDYFAAHPVTKR